MSGGVDSAVALLRAGHSAVGVTLRLWLDPDGPDSERACCSPSAVIAARTLCHSRGVPHVTLDLREEFRRAVVGPFVRGYVRGETPNPCVRCNGGFRFAELLAFARRIGAARLATGHYARIVERDGRTLLARATDPAKDQSYMLARLDPRRLAQVSFPLGTQTKAETRAEAASAGLAAAYTPSSTRKKGACGVVIGPGTPGVAHPVLPCGAKIYVRFGHKDVLTQVVDRGHTVPGHEFDVTQALAKLLGLQGTQTIQWRYAR
jgi:tRNA-specific 2-thiouridylase